MEQAKDAADLIGFDYDELDAHVDPKVGGPLIHDEAPDNVAIDYGFGDEAATQAVFDSAAHHLTYEISDNRIICNSMEPRGAWAEWNGDRLHFCFGGQGVWGMKQFLAANYRLDPEMVQVTIPDVGGGFEKCNWREQSSIWMRLPDKDLGTGYTTGCRVHQWLKMGCKRFCLAGTE